MATRRHKSEGELRSEFDREMENWTPPRAAPGEPRPQRPTFDQWVADTQNPDEMPKPPGGGPLNTPDFTDQIIKAIQSAEARRLRGQTGRTRQAAFGEMPDFSALFPIGGSR